jgi:phosphoribosyl-AMP cyclohydrolase
MLAYMNEESLQKTIETAIPGFTAVPETNSEQGRTSAMSRRWSASRATGDDDTLLIEVEQTGPACHTGKRDLLLSGIGELRNSAQKKMKRRECRGKRSRR